MGVRSESTYSRGGVGQVIGTVKRLFIEWETTNADKAKLQGILISCNAIRRPTKGI